MTATTKDSGKKANYSSGMIRDDDTNKPMFTYLFPSMIPYEEQLLHDIAMDLKNGARLYGERNYEQANSPEELRRYSESLLRHSINHAIYLERVAQMIENGEQITDNDELHERGIYFNIMCAHMVIWKYNNGSH